MMTSFFVQGVESRDDFYARYLCSCAHSAARPSARATIGYLVYNVMTDDDAGEEG